MQALHYIELETAPGGAWKRSTWQFTCAERALEFAKAIARHHWLFGVRVAGGENLQKRKA